MRTSRRARRRARCCSRCKHSGIVARFQRRTHDERRPLDALHARDRCDIGASPPALGEETVRAKRAAQNSVGSQCAGQARRNRSTRARKSADSSAGSYSPRRQGSAHCIDAGISVREPLDDVPLPRRKQGEQEARLGASHKCREKSDHFARGPRQLRRFLFRGIHETQIRFCVRPEPEETWPRLDCTLNFTGADIKEIVSLLQAAPTPEPA